MFINISKLLMNRDNYTDIDDFLQDKSFVNWVLSLNQQDVESWDSWLGNNPKRQEMAVEAAMIIQGLSFKGKPVSEEQIENALSRFHQRLEHHTDHSPVKVQKSAYRFWPVAASIAALICLTAGMLWYQQPREIIYQTGNGEQLDLKLSDGTSVSLNANSSLRFFSDNSREAWLEGEAYFEVEKKLDTRAKFLVYTEDLVVEVLGTSFNVNSHSEKTEVVLESGEVKLNLKNGDQKKMNPGDLVSYSAKSNEVVKVESAINTELHTSWKDGSLIFENLDLEKAMEKVKFTYGIAIEFQDSSIADRKVTLAVPTKNLDICIKAFEKALNLKITREEGKLLIRKGEESSLLELPAGFVV